MDYGTSRVFPASPESSTVPGCLCLSQTNESFKANRDKLQIQWKAKLKKENAVYECRLKVTVIQHISADCSFSILTSD